MTKPRKARKTRRVPDFEASGKAVPLALFPSGRVRFSPGGGSVTEARGRISELRKLVTWRAWDVLHAVQAGALDAGNVAAAVKAEGQAALLGLRATAAESRHGSVPTLNEERVRYLEWYKREKKDRSYIQVTSRTKRMLEQVRPDGKPLGDARVDVVTKGDIERAMHAVSPKPGTQNSMRAAMSGLYTWSIGEEKEAARVERRPTRWTVNPASEIDQREAHARTVTASVRQVIALLEHAELYQAAYVRVFAHIGLRKAELIHTRLHLDLDTDTWVWRLQARDPDPRCGCPQCVGKGWSPKVTRSHRAIPIPDAPADLRASILAYLDAYPCEPGDFVFRNPRTGGVWEESRLSSDFKGLCTRAGVRYGRDLGLTLHDLRATCATELDKAGVSLKYIAAMLGDSADTVMNKYLRVKPHEIGEAIRRGPAYDLHSDITEGER